MWVASTDAHNTSIFSKTTHEPTEVLQHEYARFPAPEAASTGNVSSSGQRTKQKHQTGNLIQNASNSQTSVHRVVPKQRQREKSSRGCLKTVRHDQTHTVRLPKSGLVVFVCIFACFLEAAPTPIKHALRSFKRDFVGEVWSSLRWVSDWSVLVQIVVFGRRRLPCTPQRFRTVLLQ